mmetsp:Transcript_39473/g.92324  ORF Transcript_39473/g.92324 Transcript_39473/m.92324 type:complete len:366 (-) Transcript_39473:61-1158(-)
MLRCSRPPVPIALLKSPGDDILFCAVQNAMTHFELEKQRCGSGGGAPLRVHSLVTIKVWRRKADGTEVVSEVQLLDLAGWQRAGSSSGNNTKAANRVDKVSKGKPAAAANGPAFEDLVIKAVMRVCDSLEQKMSHIPYRDSKLTRLLCNALGGKGLCLLALHVGLDSYEETEAMLQFGKRVSAIRNSVCENSINYASLQASNGERIRHLCKALGRNPEGLKTGGMAMSMASTDEEVELRDLVAECESLASLSQQWENTQRASQRFKSGEDMGPRLDRKPVRAHISEAPQAAEVAVQRPRAPRAEAGNKSGYEVPMEGGAEGAGACNEMSQHSDISATSCNEMSDIGNKLAQLQLGRKGSRLRPMS